MDGIYSVKEVCRLVGVVRETLRRWELAGEFPRRRRLSHHARGRCGYLKSEIHEWINGRPS
jgi:predicted DNA-binding transcriptional regulator AlpA